VFKTFSTKEKLCCSSTENHYFRIFVRRPAFISCVVFISLAFPSFLCKTVYIFSCGTLSTTELQSVHVLENCGFSWIRREDDITFQVSHKPSVPLIICQKCDTVFQFRFLKHFGISVMCTTACTLLLSFVLNITVTSACLLKLWG